jgi:TrmH family RNA methyltransferase
MMITSLTNSHVTHVRQLQSKRRARDKASQFVAEGARWLADLHTCNIPPQQLFYTEAWQDDALLAAVPAERRTPVSTAVMAHMSAVETPPGLLMVVPMQPLPLTDRPTLLLILDRMQNPGNMGTLLRTAAAAGVDGVLLTPGCVDVYNPKVVRGGMGAQLRVPLLSAAWDTISTITAHMHVYSASGSGSQRYDQIDWRQRSALIIGNEAHGLGDPAQTLGTPIAIPMSATTESLNAAAAAAIILFEAARQRDFRF